MTDEPISIRRAGTPSEYRACREAQRLAWGIQDESYLVPVATMVGAQLHGGVVLGAFRPDGSAVGMSFAFLGRSEGRLCLYSQLTGVVPGFQSRGLGMRLKVAQREIARAEKVPLIAWAFDPFRAGNARFNLNKLGASSRRYVVDMYGPRTDRLNLGRPTDRLIAEWETDAEVRSHELDADSSTAPRLIEIENGTPRFDERSFQAASDLALLPIPGDGESLALADAWREAVRIAFARAFQAGFRAEGFDTDDTGSGFYVLKRKNSHR